MVEHLSDQELTTLFHQHLPHKPLPPDVAARLKEQVLAAVATTLRSSSRLDAFTLPPEATPVVPFVAEQPEDQELYALFQKHMLPSSLSPEQAIHLQQQVLDVVDAASSATRAQPAITPTRHYQSQAAVQLPAERWATWWERVRQLFAQPPALALGGVASALFVVFVLIGLSRTLGIPVPSPVGTRAPAGVPSTAPSVVQRQAHVTITSGQAIIQKPDGQTETVAAGTTAHGLAPGDRLITGESTAHIEYFPGQSTTVEPGAEVELQEYAEEGATTRVALLVYSGKTSHEVNTPLAEGDLFEIRTPAAVASAKYTKLTVEVLSETQTHIETEAGTAEVLTADEEVVIAAGQQITATIDNPWFMTPTSMPTPETGANPVAMSTATASATALILLRPSEPLLPTSTATPDEPAFDVSVNPAPRETAVPAPPVIHIITMTPTPTSLPVLPTMTATPVMPPYVMVLVPTATETPIPETPTVLPTSTTVIDPVEPSTDTPTPVDTTTPTSVPVLPTRTSTETVTPTTVLVPTATKTLVPPTPTPSVTPTTVLVPTATKTLVPPTPTPSVTPTTVLVPTATKTSVPPTYTPTNTTVPPTVPTVPPTATTAAPSPTPTNTPVVLPTATNTSIPPSTATDTPQPTATATDAPVPSSTVTDTPVPTATDTPVPSPTATDTPEPTSTDTPVPSPTATDTLQPTSTPTDTLVPPMATDTPEPTSTPTDTPVPAPTDTATPVPTATDTPVPSPTATDTPEPTSTPTDTPMPS